MKDLICFLCSPFSTDEDHFSPEADAAVSEMTRGAVLVAQVQDMSGEVLLLVALLVSSALHSVLHKTQSQSLPAWLLASPGAGNFHEPLSGLGRDEYSLLFLMEAGRRGPGWVYRAQQGLLSSGSGVPWV